MKPTHTTRRRLWKWVSICALGAICPLWVIAQDTGPPIIYPVPQEAPRTYPPPYKGGKQQPIFRELADRIERVSNDDKKNPPAPAKENSAPKTTPTPAPVTAPIQMNQFDPNRKPAWRWYGYGGPVPGANPYAPSGHYAVVPPYWHAESGSTPGSVPSTYINPARPIGDYPPSKNELPKPNEKEKEKVPVFDDRDLKIGGLPPVPKGQGVSTPKPDGEPDPLIIPIDPEPEKLKGPDLLPKPKEAGDDNPPAKLGDPIKATTPTLPGTFGGGLQDLKKPEGEPEKMPTVPSMEEPLKLPTEPTPMPIPTPEKQPNTPPKPDYGPPIPVVPADGIILPSDNDLSRRPTQVGGVARGKISEQDEVPANVSKSIRESSIGEVQLVSITRTGANSLRVVIRSNSQKECIQTRDKLMQSQALRGWRIDFEVLAK